MSIILGADVTILTKSRLTPFHFAIVHGNTNVVVYYLINKRKGLSGIFHPSKAAPDGRTPLQLALGLGGNGNPGWARKPEIEIVRLLVKDATVHDVERCWDEWRVREQKQRGDVVDEGMWEEMREVMLTKVRSLVFIWICELISLSVAAHREDSYQAKNPRMIWDTMAETLHL